MALLAAILVWATATLVLGSMASQAALARAPVGSVTTSQTATAGPSSATTPPTTTAITRPTAPAVNHPSKHSISHGLRLALATVLSIVILAVSVPLLRLSIERGGSRARGMAMGELAPTLDGSDPAQPAAARPVADPPAVGQQRRVPRVDGSGEVTIDGLGSSGGPGRVHQLTVDSLAELAAQLDAVGIDDRDVVLAVPGASLVLGHPDELAQAARLLEGICVAATAVPLASPTLARQLEAAIAEAVGRPVARCQCFPGALLGTAGQLRYLLGSLPAAGSDADRISGAVLAHRDLVLDIVSFFFHTLDGTGTDVAIEAGKAYVGGEQPLVLIDPAPGGQALAAARAELADRGASGTGTRT